MNRISHFEIQADNPERAAKFYRELFGWDIKEWIVSGFEAEDENRRWLVTIGSETEPSINGGILFRRGPAPGEGQPVNAYVCTISVTDIDESVDKMLKAGGSIALPKAAVTGVGWVVYCKDLEGNIFGMMQEDWSACQ
jgi:uncharacterized protein